MAQPVGALRADLETNVGTFKSQMAQAGDSVDATANKMSGAARKANAAGKQFADFGKLVKFSIGSVAAFAITDFIAGAVKGALDAEKVEASLDKTFGAMSGSVDQWAENTSRALGRVDDDLKESVLNFGALAQKLVPTQGAAADMSEALTTLSVDIATFKNQDVGEVADALQKALAGSTRGLREYGILIDENEIKQRAVELGYARTTKEVSKQDRALAAYNLIMEKTTNLQGFAATQTDTNAGKLRKFEASLDSLADTLGSLVLPVLTKGAEILDLYATGLDKILSLDFKDAELGAQVAWAKISGGNVNEVVANWRKVHGIVDDAGRTAATNGGIIDDEFEGLGQTAEEAAKEYANIRKQVQGLAYDVFRFGVPSYDAQREAIVDLRQQNDTLKTSIEKQIADIEALDNGSARYANTLKYLRDMLGDLNTRFDHTLELQEALIDAQQRARDKSLDAALLQQDIQLDDLKRARGDKGLETNVQQQVREAEDKLWTERARLTESIANLEADRAAATLANDNEEVERLGQVIAAQETYRDLLTQTTGVQLIAAQQMQENVREWQGIASGSISDFFKSWRDSTDSNSEEIAANFIRAISDSVLNRKGDELADALFGFLGLGQKTQEVQVIKAGQIIGDIVQVNGQGGGPMGTTDATLWDFAGQAWKGVTDFFGGFFADGGTLRPGEWGVVGERGPELAKGGLGGMEVAPMTGQGGGDTTQNFFFPNANVDGFRASRRQIGQFARRELGPGT